MLGPLRRLRPSPVHSTEPTTTGYASGMTSQVARATPTDVSVATPAELRPAWLDRDISWLEFNRRVLQEALDERNPLLERVKFLAIFSSNLDEFFMKRNRKSGV